MATYTVTNTNNSGAGSLHEALTSATGPANTIDFQVIDQTITASALPALSGQMSFVGASVTLEGALSGAVSFFKQGAGTLTLAGSNTFTGTAIVWSGTLALSGGSAITDTTSIEVHGGTLRIVNAESIYSLVGPGGTVILDANLTIISGHSYSGVISGSGDLIVASSGYQSLAGTNTYTGATVVNGGTLSVASDSNLGSGAVTLAEGATLSVTGATTIDNAFSLTGSATYASTDDTTLSGVISGSGGLNKTEEGILTLSGVNTYGGATTVSAGTLTLSGGAAIADTAAVTVASGATLSLSASETVGSIAGAGSISLGAFNVTAGVDNSSTTYSGVISGTGVLTKAGSGTLTLSGTNTYSGLTTVSAGTLVLTGSLTGSTTVAAGATLTGTGTLSALTVDGALAPGASPGVLRTGALAFGATGSLAIELGGATTGQFDQLQVTGTVSLNGALNVSQYGGYAPTTTTTLVIIDNDADDAVSGSFTGLAEGATVAVGGVNFTLSYVGGTGNDVTLSYTVAAPPSDPEPPPISNVPTDGADVLTLAIAGGQVSAGDGGDTVTGNVGNDYIHGNAGDDWISAGGGSDTVLGGQGSDFLNGNAGDDVIFGDMGDDSVAGGRGDDFVHGNKGADIVLGDLGNDTLLGGQGNDVILGGDGADYLSGDLGDDVLTGGAGADIFNFLGGQGRDLITDFNRAQGDHIMLSTKQAASFQDLTSKMAMVGTDTVITLDGQTIVLSGMSMPDLTASDFIFV